jgi:hypothetical protein
MGFDADRRGQWDDFFRLIDKTRLNLSIFNANSLI